MSNYKAPQTLQELQSEFYELYRAFHGFRPRHVTDAQWEDASWLQAELDKIYGIMNKMKTTEEGRKALAEDGWIV